MLIALPRLDMSSAKRIWHWLSRRPSEQVGARFPDRGAAPVRRLGTSITSAEVAEVVIAAQIALGPGQVAIGIGELNWPLSSMISVCNRTDGIRRHRTRQDYAAGARSSTG